MVHSPWDPQTVRIILTKHFATKYCIRWSWHSHDVREALCNAYKVIQTGNEKFEVCVNKDGFKKIITVYWRADDTLICISGSEGTKSL